MPPYSDVSFRYDQSRIAPGFLSRIYAAMIQGDFTYGGPLKWGFRRNMSLDEVISWNQERLERGYRAGLEEHVRNDYRQIYLRHPLFSECRVLILSGARSLRLIVPEDELLTSVTYRSMKVQGVDHDEWKFKVHAKRVAALKALALSVWQTGLTTCVQSSTEARGFTDDESMRSGVPPEMYPFAIVPKRRLRKAWITDAEVRATPVGKSAILLERCDGHSTHKFFSRRPRRQ